ncbi:MAG: flagellar basal-body MS-ring/collar protein FliF [Candidatus Margulisiibacteriota bacterium]
MAEPASAALAAGGFDIRRLLLLAGVGIVISIAVLFFFFRGCAPSVRGTSGYTVIYSNLSLKDAANAIGRLKELAIPYEIKDEGGSIAVPKQRADEARLGLAEKNLPAGGVVGWEIFDEARLGATDFDRRIQLIRAISGELSRTIRRIQAVEDARVQIVMPETRLFAETAAPVTASVMLRLRPGATLDMAKVNGIIHLVASSVENLQTENVTVVDNTGRILTAKAAGQPVPEIPVAVGQPLPKPTTEVPPVEVVVKKEIEVVRKIVEPVVEVKEKEKEVKVEKPKEEPKEVAEVKLPLTSEEKILLIVQAKKELERNLAGKAQEILNRFYPPNSAIVKVNVEILNGNKGSKFVAEQLKVKKTTAVILIDNRVDLTKELKQATYQAIAAAIGYNRKRGDRIVMQKVPFHLATPPPEIIKGEVEKVLPTKPKMKLPVLPASWLRNIAWLMGIVAAAFVVILLIGRFRPKPKTTAKVVARPQSPPSKPTPPLSREKTNALENIKSAVERDPERIAQLLRSWLTE